MSFEMTEVKWNWRTVTVNTRSSVGPISLQFEDTKNIPQKVHRFLNKAAS